MKSKENLVFLGMMGSGKSSIGSLVAKKLKLDFIDVDKEIEKELGISIAKIFEEKGEDFSINTGSDYQLNYAINLLIG